MSKILIVDDNEDLRHELRDFFDGYDVVEASSGEQALSLLRRANDIALLLLDVMMPGISGLDVLAQVRKTDPNVKVVILTGHSSKDVAIEALKSHADDYIEKPIDILKLRDVVDHLIAKHRGEPEVAVMDLMEKMKKLTRFIQENCFKKMTLVEVADVVHMSPKYLSRVFKENMGMGFSDYKLKVKIEASKELLKKRGYTVNQIAVKLGYENPESFIRQFKKITGSTPNVYRQGNHQKKKK